jgi:hypothetical protein
VAEPVSRLSDQIDRLTEAVHTLATVQVGVHEGLPADQAALRVAEMRHELRRTLATGLHHETVLAPDTFVGSC